MRRSQKMIVAAATAAMVTTGGIAYALDLNATVNAVVTVDVEDVLHEAQIALAGVGFLAHEALEEALEITGGVAYLALHGLHQVGDRVEWVIGGVTFVAYTTVAAVLSAATYVVGGVAYFALSALFNLDDAVGFVLGGVAWVAAGVVGTALGVALPVAALAGSVVGGLLFELQDIDIFAELDINILAQLMN